MLQHGFVRVAAALPRLRVADCSYNVERILELMDQAERRAVDVLVFPELALTGYTCGDLFHQPALQGAALDALAYLLERSRAWYSRLVIVGLPWLVGDQLYNVAAVCQRGELLGVVPKSYLPTYKEFYESRWFTSGRNLVTDQIIWPGQRRVPFGTDLLFADERRAGVVVGVEICEDLWTPIPPSCLQAIAGAKILVNLSASNEVIGKASYRRQLVASQSGRCIAGYVYASCGVSESTTDVVFGGHGLIAENGNPLAESPRFQRDDALVVSEIDVERLQNDRQKTNTFNDSLAWMQGQTFRRIPMLLKSSTGRLERSVDAHPFVPRGEEQLAERCQDIFHAQVAGLAKRLEHLGKPAVAIGVSGGLDSTLALLVTCKTLDLLAVPRAKILALTMPGFGTTGRTLGNAQALMQHVGVSAREIDIRSLCLEEMRALGHRPFGINPQNQTVESLSAKLMELPIEQRVDITFENIQARMRTSLLLNTGFVIGTGDLSELALGWCTYNADHISMYNPNISIPKTLVKFLVRWAALNEFEATAQKTLLDIVATEISPELLPTAKDGTIAQSTESVIGPYELHDFFLFHFLRYGAPPEKILFLAQQATFEKVYPAAEIRRWLKVFVRRFFVNQFKRSCLPDGPKVGTISLSPRGDWRMPSDAQASVWLSWANGT
ncbi:MAG: NAD(+) synthase [Planctomycetes bacterium]|nr:NAD(+) synthase [Planctomycetota bacterium]